MLEAPPVFAHDEQLHGRLGTDPIVDSLELVVVPPRHRIEVLNSRIGAKVHRPVCEDVVAPGADNQAVLAAQRLGAVSFHPREVVDCANQPIVPAGQLAGGNNHTAVHLVEGPELFVLLPEVLFQERR